MLLLSCHGGDKWFPIRCKHGSKHVPCDRAELEGVRFATATITTSICCHHLHQNIQHLHMLCICTSTPAAMADKALLNLIWHTFGQLHVAPLMFNSAGHAVLLFLCSGAA